jgi:hypothetical protein
MKHHPWPSWRYGPNGEADIFESEADVPAGWHDHPSKHETKSKPIKQEDAPKRGRPAKIDKPLDL